MKIILLVLDEWPWWQCWFQKLLSPSKPSLCLLLLFLLQLGRLSAVSNQMTAWPGLTWTKISSLNTSASSSLPPFFLSLCSYILCCPQSTGESSKTLNRGQRAVTACQGRNFLGHTVSTNPSSSNWGFCLLEKLFTRLDFLRESGQKFHCLYIMIWQSLWYVPVQGKAQ